MNSVGLPCVLSVWVLWDMYMCGHSLCVNGFPFTLIVKSDLKDRERGCLHSLLYITLWFHPVCRYPLCLLSRISHEKTKTRERMKVWIKQRDLLPLHSLSCEAESIIDLSFLEREHFLPREESEDKHNSIWKSCLSKKILLLRTPSGHDPFDHREVCSLQSKSLLLSSLSFNKTSIECSRQNSSRRNLWFDHKREPSSPVTMFAKLERKVSLAIFWLLVWLLLCFRWSTSCLLTFSHTVLYWTFHWWLNKHLACRSSLMLLTQNTHTHSWFSQFWERLFHNQTVHLIVKCLRKCIVPMSEITLKDVKTNNRVFHHCLSYFCLTDLRIWLPKLVSLTWKTNYSPTKCFCMNMAFSNCLNKKCAETQRMAMRSLSCMPSMR